MELAFPQFEIYFCITTALHNPVDMAIMFLIRITVYQYIVQVLRSKIMRGFSYGIINVALEIHWCVCGLKLHWHWFKQSIADLKSSLMFIPFINSQQIERPSEIQLPIYLSFP